MLVALAALLAAAPAAADRILAAALEGLSVTRSRAGAVSDERKALAQLKADVNDFTVIRNVLAAFLFTGDGGAMAERYEDRGRDLQQRAVALSAELERAEAAGGPQAALDADAARRRADALRLDVLAWTFLPAAVFEIDSRSRMDFAAHRPAFIEGMRRVAYHGDYQGARKLVLDSLG
jgi:hypothetical protein